METEGKCDGETGYRAGCFTPTLASPPRLAETGLGASPGLPQISDVHSARWQNRGDDRYLFEMGLFMVPECKSHPIYRDISMTGEL